MSVVALLTALTIDSDTGALWTGAVDGALLLGYAALALIAKAPDRPCRFVTLVLPRDR